MRPQQVTIDLAQKWLDAQESNNFDQFGSSDISSFSTMQKVIFLTKLSEKVPLQHRTLDEMEQAYKLTNYRNSEVRFSWLSLALKSHYEKVFDATVHMLGSQGRMKFTRPLYRLLFACPNGRDLARQTFLRLRNFYHPICARLVEGDLGL
ncbi:Leucyl aminopeptidase yscIV [Spiromyces aspiralis]|uniref:Leucyl aminopeptidase yscIV n=1 Tax=Spiromyces aspiralis TaxID=68401 RepID=A0ACC1HH19_9FUNG|nr:Leucyl aminopeptidase yscIV [Spiromyces aspiralis]